MRFHIRAAAFLPRPVFKSLFIACAVLPLVLSSTAQVPLAITYAPNERLQLSWDDASGLFALETTDALGNAWQSVDVVPVVNGSRRSVEITPATSTRFFRLRQMIARLTIASASPAQGETGVAVTRETIFRLSGALSADTLLTTNQVYAVAGGRRILSRVELNSDRRTVTLFYLERLPADARVEATFDGTGLFDAANLPVDLDGDGVIHGAARLTFETLSTMALSTTGIEGHVFASEKMSNGSNRPLSGVTITVDGMEETLRTTTDTNGFFRLMPCPAGRFFVSVDGRTAVGSQWPGGAYYPFVGKAWDAVPGRTNNLAGGSGVIYLPLIQADALRAVSTTTETKIIFAPSLLATNPTLAGVEISIPPNTLFSDNGTRGGMVGIAPVSPDRLPEPLPPGLNMPLVITIQTDGASNFDRPVPIRFPNLPDPLTGVLLPPGAKTALWSFNHDTGRWEMQGPATVTLDGLFVVSDPGVGVLQPGWHGTAPGSGGGGPGGGPGGGGDDDDDDDDDDDEEEGKDDPCKTEAALTFLATSDLLLDVSFELAGGKLDPVSSCALGTGINAGRASRDCLIVNTPSACTDTIINNAIGTGLGCIPKVGAILNLGWGVKGLIDNVFAWHSCESRQTAPAPQEKSIKAVSNQRLAALERIIQNLEKQVALAEAAAGLTTALYGSAAWRGPASPDDAAVYQNFFARVVGAIAPSSPGGKMITTEERMEVVALPRPEGVGANEVDRVITRVESMANGGFATNATLRAEVLAAYQQFVSVGEPLLAAGWPNYFYGLQEAVRQISALVSAGNLPRGSVAAAASPTDKAAKADQVAPRMFEFPRRQLVFHLKNVEDAFEIRGRLNSQGRFDNLILAPLAFYRIAYLDLDTLRVGTAYFRSAGAGNTTTVPAALMLEDTGMDRDADGLSDDAERILGTNPAAADSDGDGVSDGAEVGARTNPNDGEPLGLGVIATRDTPGTAVEIDTVNDLAVVADSTSGLAVFSVVNPLAPVLVSQFIPTNGVSYDAVAAAGDFVAAVPGTAIAATAGIHLFGRTADGTLTAAGRVAIGAVSRAVVAAGRYAYALGRSASVATLAVVQLNGPVLLRHVSIPGGSNIIALAIDGDVLWALGSARLFSFRISGDNLLPLGQLAVSGLGTSPLEPGLELTAGNGRVYVGGFQGFHVIDGSNPAAPTLLYAPPTTQAAIHDFALNGSGLLLPVTSFSGTTTLSLSAYDIRSDRSTNFLTSFDTPGTTRAVVLHRGYALAADGAAGLAVVNFLSPDRGTNPPTVALRAFVSHPPSSQEADQTFFVSTTTSDDVQVRDVEFYIDGAAVARSGKFPFAATLRAPPLTAVKTNFVLRAKATDTGGNSAWSSEVTLTLLPDLTPPRVIAFNPAPNSTPPRGSVSTLSVAFDSAIDLTSLNNGWTLSTAGADGNLGTADDARVSGGTITFETAQRTAFHRFTAPLPPGKYRGRLASSVADLGGNLLGTNVTWDFTLPPPLALAFTPPHNSTPARGSVSALSAVFDATLDLASLRSGWTLASAGADGNLGTADDALVNGGEITFTQRTALRQFSAPLLSGRYRARFASTVMALGGDILGTNVTWDFTIPAARAVEAFPANQSVWLPGTLRRFEVRFDERLNPASITTSSLRVVTTNLPNPLTLSGGVPSLFTDERTAVLEFPEPISNGVYRVIFTSEIRDVYGSPVATNFPVLLTVKGPTLWTNDASGLWSVNTNWSNRTVPILNDHVIIDRPGTAPTISLRTAVTVTTLRSQESFAMDSFNANLTVLDQAIFNGPFSKANGSTLTSPFLEFRGSANLGGTINIGDEAIFMGPVTVTNVTDFGLNGGRSRFFDRFDNRRNTSLGSHVLTLEPGAIGTLGDNQVGFGGANSRFIIAAGARLEITATNILTGSSSFSGSQGETGARCENAGEFIKRGADATFFTRVELLNTGNISVEQGLLDAGSDFANTGTIIVAAGARLDTGGDFRHGFTGRIMGAGYVEIPDNAIMDGSYEVTGTTEVSRAQSSALFNAPIRSTGAWLITGSATFNGTMTELLGPVTLRGGQLILNSPGETRLPDLRLEVNQILGGGNVIGGSGLLVFREPRTWTEQVQLLDTLRVRFEASVTFATNFIVSEEARVDLAADSRWTGGSLSGNIQISSNVVLELAVTNTAGLSIPFPRDGILRKTGSGSVSLSGFGNISGGGNIVTNFSLFDILAGSVSISSLNGSFFVQDAGTLRLAAGTSLTTDALRLLGGQLTGAGTVSVRSSSVNRGCHLAATVSPGEPYGTLRFTGVGFPIWMAGSTTIIDLGGTTPGVNHDQIAVERSIQIDGGTLEIRTAAGFTPALGQEFTIITGSGRTGTFPTVTGLDLGNGRRYRVIYETQAIKLRVEGQ